MVRAGNTDHHHHQQQQQPPETGEDDSKDLLAAGNGGSAQKDGTSSEQKANSTRSKHSETEQRRRCKINERLQILKDLIPPNDQKRDKASLLLEVIEYIQFLQEKVPVYEGSHPGCGQEPAKLVPWRGSHVPVEGIVDHSPLFKSDSGPENNVVHTVRSEHQSAELNFPGANSYRGNEHLSDPDTSAVPLSMALQPSTYPSGTSILPSENRPCHPLLQSCLGGPSRMEHPISDSLSGETESGDVSSAYSDRLLKNLTQAFQSSGVDLSQCSISVQLDISKRAEASVAAAASAMGAIEKVSPCCGSMPKTEFGGNDDSSPSAKRPRMGDSRVLIARP